MNIDDLRGSIPALEDVVYLNTPTAPPGARPVVDALRGALDEWASGRFSWQAWEANAEATREPFGRLVGMAPSSVALVPSVAEAAATVSRSLPPGRVVVGSREFQSNLFPWTMIRRPGVEVEEVPASDGVVRTEALVDAIDEGVVLVAVSEVQSSTGFRVQLGPIAQRCREVGARLFVNGTQALGVLRFDPSVRPDFVAAHGYKWLLGVRGCAWLAVRPDRLSELEPLAPNWKSVERPYDEYYGHENLAPDARRLDLGLAWFPWVGTRAALDLLGSLDPAAVEERALGLARSFRDEARSLGLTVVREEAPTQIVSVSAPQGPAALRDRLRERNVIGAVRAGSLRLGFHAYNDESDVGAALDALGRR